MSRPLEQAREAGHERRWVPVEPTSKMGLSACMAWNNAGHGMSMKPDEVAAIWQAMLASAPAPESGADELAVVAWRWRWKGDDRWYPVTHTGHCPAESEQDALVTLSSAQSAIAAARTDAEKARSEAAYFDARRRDWQKEATAQNARAEALEADNARLRRELETMREALKPFASEAKGWPDDTPDHARAGMTDFSVGELRRARAALAGEDAS